MSKAQTGYVEDRGVGVEGGGGGWRIPPSLLLMPDPAWLNEDSPCTNQCHRAREPPGKGVEGKGRAA